MAKSTLKCPSCEEGLFYPHEPSPDGKMIAASCDSCGASMMVEADSVPAFKEKD